MDRVILLASYGYDTSFLNLADRAEHSARVIVDLLRAALPISSVADFGCALGTWLSIWLQAGVHDVVGVDGPYVPTNQLRIPPPSFRAHDLSASIDLGRRFDLVESMEVAEHLPETAAADFVSCLVRHSDVVLFSAAPPGQGGEHHVNERPYDYWRTLFSRHGFRLFDWLRPQLANRTDIQYWYRYNLFIFVAEGRVSALPEAVRASEIQAGVAIPDVSPWTYQVRKSLVRRLNPSVQGGISRIMLRLRGC